MTTRICDCCKTKTDEKRLWKYVIEGPFVYGVVHEEECADLCSGCAASIRFVRLNLTKEKR